MGGQAGPQGPGVGALARAEKVLKSFSTFPLPQFGQSSESPSELTPTRTSNSLEQSSHRNSIKGIFVILLLFIMDVFLVFPKPGAVVSPSDAPGAFGSFHRGRVCL